MANALAATARARTEPLHVLDLPQLYTNPSFPQLLSVLELVAVAPAPWDGNSGTGSLEASQEEGGFNARKVREEGLPAYLTSIIKSPLSWLSSPSERERIWETASVRLSERAGRTARPGLTRAFTIPKNTNDSITIYLHEPTLTSDNLGLKTWASSYLLAKRLGSLSLSVQEQQHVLELGAGTGLVGIAAAALWGARVHLTDLPAIIPNLRRNVAESVEVIEKKGGVATVGVLDWGDVGNGGESSEEGDGREGYPLVLVADPIYSPEHPRLLVQTIVRFLKKEESSRVVIELPLREAYKPEIRELKERMKGVGLGVLEEGEEIGFDDWGGGAEGELREVKCWWGIWGWTDRGC